MIDVKDRIIQYPSRYELTEVSAGVYDLTQVTGTVTEEGTPVNKALFEDIKSESNMSLLAFCTNANADSLDCGFGKNNEDTIRGIGRQLARYSWFKGDSKTTYPYTNLQEKNSLSDCVIDLNSKSEIQVNENLIDLISLSPYAKGIVDNYIPIPPSSTDYTIVASAIKTLATEVVIDATTEYFSDTLTVPYTGKYTISPRMNFVASSLAMYKTYIYRLYKNNEVIYTQTSDMPNPYSALGGFNDQTYFMEQGDVFKASLKLSTDWDGVPHAKGEFSLYLLASRDCIFPSTPIAGTYPVWIAPKVQSQGGTCTTQMFTAPATGTYTVYICAEYYGYPGQTSFYLYKNGTTALISDTSSSGSRKRITQNFALTIGDTLHVVNDSYSGGSAYGCSISSFVIKSSIQPVYPYGV